MEQIEIRPVKSFKGTIKLPGDKSVSHRSIIISSLAKGISEIENFLEAEDCLNTLHIFQQLGISIEKKNKKIYVKGEGLFDLKEPLNVLDVGNSGTTIRLLTGLLSGQKFYSVLTGDDSIRKRPMDRVITPLRKMGAQILGRGNNSYAPLTIVGKKLTPISYTMPVASAQVKSAMLLAGLSCDGETEVIEPIASRNHTELMLSYFGAKVKSEGLKIKIYGGYPLKSRKIEIPSDISSAAFFIVGATILDKSNVVIKDVGINPTRTGIIEVLQKMGGNIEVFNKSCLSADRRNEAGEEIADLRIKSAELKGIIIEGEIIPRVIDEIPILAIAGLFAEGETIIRDAKELRVKESDRIKTLTTELRKAGAKVEELPDGMIIQGNKNLKGTTFESYGDHRIAMSLAILGSKIKGKTIIKNTSCIKTSFPEFEKILNELTM